jgi:hypothetical protein
MHGRLLAKLGQASYQERIALQRLIDLKLMKVQPGTPAVRCFNSGRISQSLPRCCEHG